MTAENLRVLENVEVQMTVEVGNTEIKIRDLLRLNEGAVIELDRLAGDPLDILVNGTMIAKGEIVWWRTIWCSVHRNRGSRKAG